MYGRYTEYLRDIMRNELTRPLLDKALSTYPIYAPEKDYDLIPTREELNKKLLDHWKYHEIGFETVGRFLDELEITMCEIMPRYNELFKTIQIMADIPNPFDNVDITETFEQERQDSASSEGSSTNTQTANGKTTTKNDTTNNGTVSEETSGSSSSERSGETSGQNTQNTSEKHIKVDTPQDALTVPAEGIDGLDYATEGNWDKNNTSGSTSGTESSSESGTSEGTTQRTTSDTSSVEGSNESESSASEVGSNNTSSESSGIVRHTLTRKGQQGVTTFARDINEFRTSIMDVVDQIITDIRIAELFMMVY